MTAYGADVAVPISVPLRKNSTFAIVPSESAAVAVSVMVDPGLNVALLIGAVMDTVGA